MIYHGNASGDFLYSMKYFALFAPFCCMHLLFTHFFMINSPTQFSRDKTRSREVEINMIIDKIYFGCLSIFAHPSRWHFNVNGRVQKKLYVCVQRCIIVITI
ncbi:hypothetical protein RIF29_13811 [Crotalaria pallida]|uniref:Uncharacterized protein n=1 Tax=Crotalaria pallida TaxID=3830 RepID=A0AAN9P2Q6_CROPI